MRMTSMENRFNLELCKIDFYDEPIAAMRDLTGAMERRAVILKVDKKITREVKKNFPYKEILKEIPGIFNNAMEGLRMVLKTESFTESDAMRSELRKWIKGNDQVGRFIDEVLTVDEKAYTSVEDMYIAYTDFTEENGEKALGKYKFGQRLEDMGYKKKQVRESSRQFWAWIGLSIPITDFDQL